MSVHASRYYKTSLGLHSAERKSLLGNTVADAIKHVLKQVLQLGIKYELNVAQIFLTSRTNSRFVVVFKKIFLRQ